jgi:hypothetical protein
LTFGGSGSRCCCRAWPTVCQGQRIVREEPTDLVFVVFFARSWVLVFRSVLSVLLVARSLANCPRGECGQSLQHGRSASRARTIHFSRCNTGGSSANFRLSAPYLRTVRLSLAVGVLYRWTVNLYRSCVGLGWLAQETTTFILVRTSEE